ncbi:MAG: hypothetical protein ACXACA_02915 [Candidatus Ranarchaeia archaeon]|jgi:hypothetical protein
MKVEIELDELTELKERIESLEYENYNQSYNGNSIGYIHQKMVAYRNQVGDLHDGFALIDQWMDVYDTAFGDSPMDALNKISELRDQTDAFKEKRK